MCEQQSEPSSLLCIELEIKKIIWCQVNLHLITSFEIVLDGISDSVKDLGV